MQSVNRPIDQGAIADLAIGSNFLGSLGTATTTIQAHAIVGTIDPAYEVAITPVLSSVLNIVCPLVLPLGLPALFNLQPNDLLVSSDSQQAGFLNGASNLNPNDISHFSFPNPLNLLSIGTAQLGPIGALANNSGNVESVVELLNSLASSPLFESVK